MGVVALQRKILVLVFLFQEKKQKKAYCREEV